jgi:hypothetical protein
MKARSTDRVNASAGEFLMCGFLLVVYANAARTGHARARHGGAFKSGCLAGAAAVGSGVLRFNSKRNF